MRPRRAGGRRAAGCAPWPAGRTPRSRTPRPPSRPAPPPATSAAWRNGARCASARGPSGHQHPELVDVGPLAVALADDRALVHHEHAVGQSEDLVEILRDHQYRDTAGGCGAQQFVHVLDGADVEPARGRSHYERAGGTGELAADHDLLEVAAGEVARTRFGPGCAHGVTGYQLTRATRDTAAAQEWPNADVRVS